MKPTILTLFTVLFLTVFIAIKAVAQQSEYSINKVDSLKNELKHAKHDTARLTLLCHIANAYSPAGQTTLSMQYVKQAEVLSNRINTPKSRLKWLYASAVANYYPANLNVAIVRFTHFAALADSLHKPTEKYASLIYLASCEKVIGKSDTALQRLKTATSYFKKVRNNKLISAALSEMSSTYSWMGKQPEALQFAQEGLTYAKAANDVSMIFTIQCSIAAIEIKNKNFDKALTLLNSIEKLFKGYETWPQHTEFLSLRAGVYQRLGNFSKAIEGYLLMVTIATKKSNQYELMLAYNSLGYIYTLLNDHQKAIVSFKKALDAAKKAPQVTASSTGFINERIAYNLLQLGDFKQAVIYAKQAVAQATDIRSKAFITNSLAWIYFKMKDYSQALSVIKQAITITADNKTYSQFAYGTLGSIIREASDKELQAAGINPANRKTLMLAYLKGGLEATIKSKNASGVKDSYLELSLAYEKLNNYQDAFKYYKRYQQISDSLNLATQNTTAQQKIARFEYEKREDSLKYVQRLATQHLNEQMKLQKAEIKSKKYQSYFYMGGLAALVVLSGFIGLNYYNQRKANAIINEANAELSNKQEEITAQRDQLADAITELRAAQTQLIQSEKMASLGELTAGIAHEIQNPLNFVNNFSEVSSEMLAELNDELVKGDVAEAQYLAGELKEALEKINHHGKRADSIVKGMLEHSRASSGQKEPTNINKLTDEYLRLAYHGLRAKDKSFNAELVTHFTDDLPTAQVIPQEMGRVLLNLFNNAFYAVHQKQKSIGANYKPTVEVSTALNNNHLQITVKDNGTGIPNDIKDKIMQPFFTTKPTGQGTGLGLSLSYDVVVKVHGGKINVESIPDEQSIFTVSLPV